MELAKPTFVNFIIPEYVAHTYHDPTDLDWTRFYVDVDNFSFFNATSSFCEEFILTLTSSLCPVDYIYAKYQGLCDYGATEMHVKNPFYVMDTFENAAFISILGITYICSIESYIGQDQELGVVILITILNIEY
ncbi:hypothetical protein A3Q56_04154 [Intoshia linei]|uniref:Uncharacterized protein n=1 Tax=Intoshia linei TaxID=1819745 RepID=A0A177B1E4_9BILA|nr:hypothetical protein A3Q56_04154 [Intoshia linei]